MYTILFNILIIGDKEWCTFGRYSSWVLLQNPEPLQRQASGAFSPGEDSKLSHVQIIKPVHFLVYYLKWKWAVNTTQLTIITY